MAQDVERCGSLLVRIETLAPSGSGRCKSRTSPLTRIANAAFARPGPRPGEIGARRAGRQGLVAAIRQDDLNLRRGMRYGVGTVRCAARASRIGNTKLPKTE